MAVWVALKSFVMAITRGVFLCSPLRLCLLPCPVRRSRRRGTVASLRASLAANKRLTLITGFGLAVYQTAYFAAVQQAGITVATVVTLGSGPVLVAIGARFMLDERVGAAAAASVRSGVVGLVLLMRSTGGAAGPDPRLGRRADRLLGLQRRRHWHTPCSSSV